MGNLLLAKLQQIVNNDLQSGALNHYRGISGYYPELSGFVKAGGFCLIRVIVASDPLLDTKVGPYSSSRSRAIAVLIAGSPVHGERSARPSG